MNQVFIGIDVSAATLDICIKVNDSLSFVVIKNQIKDIKKFLQPYQDQNVKIAMENTGRYNWAFYEALSGFEFTTYVISPLHLKKSLGLVRGKNDKIDAERIVSFLIKNHLDLRPWVCPSTTIQKLKIWITERNHRIKSKRQLSTMNKDYPKMKGLGIDKSLKMMNKKLIASLDAQIMAIEKEITLLLKVDSEIQKQVELIGSVPGVGKVLSWEIIAKTNGFTTIKTPREMACYCGVAPFEYQSGTSIYRKPAVSHLADKTIKSLLHLGAMSAIRLKNDLGEYYRRKVAEGKNKMSVINAVRNKIIHRIYAVLKNQTIYQNNLVLS
ncbi:transposase IS116/IS110/IS902 family protein [Pedobacter glucosidilyticus]|nr:IS110 family transposase [Pedobacter glucosidilyticus]KHJ38372.1 transposase IS116/IS110/IS902 family protein [Pedobacter glucosidilyticus]